MIFVRSNLFSHRCAYSSMDLYFAVKSRITILLLIGTILTSMVLSVVTTNPVRDRKRKRYLQSHFDNIWSGQI